MQENNFHYISISGSGRSGTNITKKIFSNHPQVYTLPFEYRFTIDPYGIIDLYNTLKYSWSPYILHERIRTFENFISRVSQKNKLQVFLGKIIKFFDKRGNRITPPKYLGWELEQWFPNYKIHIQQLLNELIDFKYNSSWPGEKGLQINNQMNFVAHNKDLEQIFRKFLTELYNDILKKNTKNFFVEDNTWSILFAADLLEIMPMTKMIHIFRDPRDVVCSFLKQRWTPLTLEENIQYYSSIMDRVNDNPDKVAAGKILEVCFESLVVDTEKEVKKMCAFSGMEFDGKMLNVDLSKNNTGRWKLDLNTSEQMLINQKLEKYLKFYNYNN